jgi:hypothetical protein
MPQLGTSDTATDPFYLSIPLSRYLLMSFFTLGLYQTYRIYKNWEYVKNRDNLQIHPFWRAVFGIFFCHSLMKQIHDDPLLQQHKPADFNPTGLAAGWIIFSIGGNLANRLLDKLFPDEVEVTLLVILLLLAVQISCFVPVQQYVNAVNEALRPDARYYPLSAGHYVLLGYVIVIIVAVFILAAVAP